MSEPMTLNEALRRLLEWPNPQGTIEKAYIPGWLATECRAALDAAAVTQGAGTEEVERLAEQAIINCWYSAGGGRRGIDGVVRPAVGAWERRISFARTIEREVRSSLAARAAPASTGDVEYEVSVVGPDGESEYQVAATSGPENRAHPEALRYAHQYVEEGPVIVRRVIRTEVCRMMGAAPSSPSAEPQAGEEAR